TGIAPGLRTPGRPRMRPTTAPTAACAGDPAAIIAVTSATRSRPMQTAGSLGSLDTAIQIADSSADAREPRRSAPSVRRMTALEERFRRVTAAHWLSPAVAAALRATRPAA